MILITRHSFIVNFLVHFSLFFNELLTAKPLSHPMIMAETILLVMNVCRKYEATS